MSAVISECGLYRYSLTRALADYGLRTEYRGDSYHPSPMPGPLFLFIGVNPSTADAVKDDATVRKWIGFTERWGGRGFLVGNAFAYRATDVRALAALPPAEAIGLMNDWHLMQMASKADVIVPCWGNVKKVPPNLRARFAFLAQMLTGADKPIRVFGLTKDGDPLHPLMLPYSTQLQEWKP